LEITLAKTRTFYFLWGIIKLQSQVYSLRLYNSSVLGQVWTLLHQYDLKDGSCVFSESSAVLVISMFSNSVREIEGRDLGLPLSVLALPGCYSQYEQCSRRVAASPTPW